MPKKSTASRTKPKKSRPLWMKRDRQILPERLRKLPKTISKLKNDIKIKRDHHDPVFLSPVIAHIVNDMTDFCHKDLFLGKIFK